MHLSNQENFDTNVISMDLEDVKASHYDVMRMAGKLLISRENQPFQKRLDSRLVPGIAEDGWKQAPRKIMFGDTLQWYSIISLPLKRN